MNSQRRRKPKQLVKFWAIPKLWPGATVFMLGGGPSLADVDFDLIKDFRVIAVNNAFGDAIKSATGKTIRYEPRQWVDVCFFGDKRWYNWQVDDYGGGIKEFGGILVTRKQAGVNGNGRIKVVPVKKAWGLYHSPDGIGWSENSGCAAINVAVHMGAKRIVLLGFDMRSINGEFNYHRDHKTSRHQGPKAATEKMSDPCPTFLKAFPIIRNDVERMGVEILNATPGSAIKEFEFVDLKDIVDELRSQ